MLNPNKQLVPNKLWDKAPNASTFRIPPFQMDARHWLEGCAEKEEREKTQRLLGTLKFLPMGDSTQGEGVFQL